MYEVLIEKQCSKEIDSLPLQIQNLALNAFKILAVNPRPHGVKKLLGDSGWRIRIGDYRILYTIDDNKKIVKVYRIKHRKDVYR